MKCFFNLLFLFFSVSGLSQFSYSVESIPEDLLAGANSILVNKNMTVDVSKADRMVVKNHWAITVLNERGDDDVRAFVHYDNNQKISNVEVYVYDATGKEIEHFKKRDFTDRGLVDGISFYNDSRTLILHYTPTTYPYTMVFTSEIRNSSSAFIPPWFPLERYAMATQKSVYKLIYDPANKPRFRKANLENHEISFSENANEFILAAKNLKPIKYEAFGPSFRKMAPQVSFSLNEFYLEGVFGQAGNWREFGLWMEEKLLSDVSELPESTVSMAKELVKNETTNIGKARKIYDFLQNKVRYISVQIGIGGWKPMSAEKVDQLGYGDCKALTNYTKALLDAVGVPSYYTILYAGKEERDITENFSSLQGNHVILGIPEGDGIIWLECTSQQVPFGFGGNFSDDRNVLMITPEGGKIARTKKYGFKENLQTSTTTAKIDVSGNLSASVQRISKGLQYDNKYRLAYQGKTDLKKSYKDEWSHINGMDIQNIQLENNKKAIVFTEKLDLKISNYCPSVGNDFLFNANIFNRFDYVPPRYSERKHNMQIDEGFTDMDTVKIEIPQGYGIGDLPVGETIENEFGNYTFNFKKTSGNTLVYTRKFILKKGTFPPSTYENFRAFLRKVSQMDKTKMILKKIQP